MKRPNPSAPTGNVISSLSLVDPTDVNPVGSADVGEMISIAHDNLGVDPEIDVPSDWIAIQAIAKAISARIRNEGFASDAKVLSVFLISDRARGDAQQLSAHKEPIVDNGSLAFAGSLWIAGPAFRSAYKRSFSKTSTPEIFDELEKLGLGQSPIFLFDPNASDLELRYYCNGVSDADTVQRFLISQHEFSIDALDRVLKRFHETSIITPDATIGPEGAWLDAKKYIPRKDTEAFLQNWLKMVLNAFFQAPFSCDWEVPGNEGRCDLMLKGKHPTQKNTVVHHAVMELKVLRSKTSGNKAVPEATRKAAIEGGLRQAIAYKSERDASVGMLCCFDMRATDQCDHNACFTPISQKAADEKIELRRYRMYGSSADFRAETYA